MTIKAIIIDDERPGVNVLENLLSKIPNVTLLGSAPSLIEGIELIEATQPNLVFLDVHLPDENGFDLFQEIHPIPFEVIITSAFDYGLDAIKNEVVDYLLKPYRSEDLESSIKKVEKKLMLKKLAKVKAESRADLNVYHSTKSLDKIGIPGKNGLIFLKISEIVRCEGLINYTRIFLKSQETITCAKTLLEFEKMLAPCNFFRVHKSHLVNLEYLTEFIRGNNPHVILTDNVSVQVSRRNKYPLLQRLSQLQRNRRPAISQFFPESLNIGVR